MPRLHGAVEVRNPYREDELQNYWTVDKRDVAFDGYIFRSILIRREVLGEARTLSIDPIVNTISWADNSPVDKATVTVTNPSKTKPLPIKEGHEIKIEWAAVGRTGWHNLLRLRVNSIGRTTSSGSVTLELVDEGAWFAKAKDDYSFKKAKKNDLKNGKRVGGWTADQIAKAVCKQMGIRVGKLAKGKAQINNLTEEGATGLAVIIKAYKLDREETGRKFVVSIRDGALQVTQLRRSKDLLLVGEHLIEAGLQTSLKGSFATLIELTATGPKGKDGKREKIELEIRSSDAAMRLYGVIRAQWKLDNPATSKGDARARIKRKLAESQQPNQELTMSMPGIPTVKRGDALKITLEQEALSELIYISSVTHNVGAGSYTMDVTASFEDPFVDEEGEKTREKICKKARKKNRRPPSFCEAGYDPFAPNVPPRQRHRRDTR